MNTNDKKFIGIELGDPGWMHSFFLPSPAFIWQLFRMPRSIVAIINRIEKCNDGLLTGVRPSDSEIPHILSGRAKASTEEQLHAYLAPLTEMIPDDITEDIQAGGRYFNFGRWRSFLLGMPFNETDNPELIQAIRFLNERIEQEVERYDFWKKVSESQLNDEEKQKALEDDLFSRLLLPDSFSEWLKSDTTILVAWEKNRPTDASLAQLDLLVQMDFIFSFLAHLEKGIIHYLRNQLQRPLLWLPDCGQAGMMYWVLPRMEKGKVITPLAQFLDGMRHLFDKSQEPIPWKKMAKYIPVPETVMAEGNMAENQIDAMKKWRKSKILPSADRLTGFIDSFTADPDERRCLLYLSHISVALTKLYQHQVKTLQKFHIGDTDVLVISAYQHYTAHRQSVFHTLA